MAGRFYSLAIKLLGKEIEIPIGYNILKLLIFFLRNQTGLTHQQNEE